MRRGYRQPSRPSTPPSRHASNDDNVPIRAAEKGWLTNNVKEVIWHRADLFFVQFVLARPRGNSYVVDPQIKRRSRKVWVSTEME